ncbi:iron dicitrate transport regulator FecR [Chitinophaga parva]|uniref:Iron dicitrate transport regulator FecR n=1 Tax=Chitinophaga parva TaxID=2169414 RepID=A0A2T7BPX3_9BACT|nr:FecR family protein [Chitinophaga parva]PUZ29728.1 iron dicitrate transport regulator FecR [Chitinophaga parva]
MSTQDRLAYLVQQVLHGNATPLELQELSDLVAEDMTGATAQQVEILLRNILPAATDAYDEARWDQVAGSILAADHPAGITAPPAKIIPLHHRTRLVAAVVAGLLVVGGGYWLLRKPASKPVAMAPVTAVQDVAPGGNRAMLTLADGTQVPLDSTGGSTLPRQGNTQVVSPGAGQLTYRQTGNNNAPAPFNTLRTPRGGQFQVTLPDGTQVWLNAASTLQYPVAFTGTERRVTLQGEAYFEVAGNANHPFHVNVLTGADSMDVAVLGTHFNIMAYEDEPEVRTTLLEGAVRVSSHDNNKQLHPGQGALLDKTAGHLTIEEVNTEEATAWKNGYLQLAGNDIQSAMRLISRWYDVDVVYKAPVLAHFRGIIPRNVPVSQVLKMMELTGEVHFEIKGKQLIVSP